MGGWNDPNELVIAGTGQVYVGAVGSTLPTTPTATPDTAFSGLGYHSEDGVSVNADPEIVEHKGWQSKFALRRVRESEQFRLSFALLQWNEISVPLAFGGGQITNPSGSIYKYQPPSANDAIYERAVICDVADGSRHIRFILPRVTVVEGVDSKFTRSAMAELPITVESLEPSDNADAWYFLTDDAAAFAAGS